MSFLGKVKGKLIVSCQALPDEPLHIHSFVENETALCKGVNQDGEVAFVCAMELDR